jgi:hypothetical protein
VNVIIACGHGLILTPSSLSYVAYLTYVAYLHKTDLV